MFPSGRRFNRPSRWFRVPASSGRAPTIRSFGEYARERGLVIVTKDADFSHRILVSMPPTWIVYLRFKRAFAEAFLEGLIVKRPVSQVPWVQIIRVIQMVKAHAARVWRHRFGRRRPGGRNVGWFDRPLAAQFLGPEWTRTSQKPDSNQGQTPAALTFPTNWFQSLKRRFGFAWLRITQFASKVAPRS